LEKGFVVDDILHRGTPLILDTKSEGWADKMMDERDKFFIACVTTAIAVFVIIYILMRVLLVIAQVDR